MFLEFEFARIGFIDIFDGVDSLLVFFESFLSDFLSFHVVSLVLIDLELFFGSLEFGSGLGFVDLLDFWVFGLSLWGWDNWN